MTTFLFCLSMFLTIWSLVLIIGRLITKEPISWQIVVFASSCTWVITHFMHIW